jgi:tetratricopeptide (TPR) repeat protein
VAESIVRGVVPRIQVGELNRARLHGPEQRDTYDLFLCARSDTHNFSRAVFDHAGQLYPEVLARDPQYAEAWAWWAYYFLLRVGQGWSTDPASDVAKADEFARRAVECDPFNPMALAIRGHVAAYLCRDFGTAFQSLDTALQINPYLGFALVCSAAARAYTGRGGRAVEEIERAIALSPHSPLMYASTSIASLACLASGQAERALEYAWRSVAENPQYTTGLKVLITSLVQADRTAEAEAAVRQLLALEPSFSVERFRHFSPTTSSEVGDVFCRSLARAGVPAGG